MSLTNAQYTTLADHIRSNTDPDVVAALAVRNDTELTRLYNLDSATWVWKTVVTKRELRAAFDWDEVVTNLSATDWQAWAELTADGQVDGSDANIRAGFARIFTGPNVVNTRTALLAAAKRVASVYESLFSAGTGTEGDPATVVIVGPVDTQTIGLALNRF